MNPTNATILIHKGYLRYFILPRLRSYGLISMDTVSPSTIFILFCLILPDNEHNTSFLPTLDGTEIIKKPLPKADSTVPSQTKQSDDNLLSFLKVLL
jgi:hypothetical protein